MIPTKWNVPQHNHPNNVILMSKIHGIIVITLSPRKANISKEMKYLRVMLESAVVKLIASEVLLTSTRKEVLSGNHS